MGKWKHGLEVLPYSKEPGKEFGQQEYSYCPFILLQDGGIVPLEDRFGSSLSICLQNENRDIFFGNNAESAQKAVGSRLIPAAHD